MSDFRDATFIPQQPPHKAILDYSNTLSGSALNSLESQAVSLQSIMKVKAVILPSDFHVDSFPQFSSDLGQQWHVSGNRLLIIVDVKDHKVEMLSGRDLANAGLDHNVISQQIVPQNFVPYMKRNDLQGALSNSMTAASNVVSQGRTTSGGSSSGVTTTYSGAPSGTAPQQNYSLWHVVSPFLVIGVVCVGLWLLSVRQRAADNKKLSAQFRERVGPLYEQADQIGSASEYLVTAQHPELAQRIATFFNRLTTFETAVREAEQLEKTKKIYQVRDAYLNLIRMAGLLLPEAAQLREDLNAVTGGVETYKPDVTPSLAEQAAQQKAAEEGGQFIKIPEKVFQSQNYRRPSWSYEPAYYQPVDNGLGGLASMMLMMNQMQMMSYGMNALQAGRYNNDNATFGGWFGGNSNNTGASGNSGSSFDSGGGGWGSSGGGSDFDMGGGGWDSGGGGDSGGGDSGGGDW
jgi:uncharacterized membrane protein YgcG